VRSFKLKASSLKLIGIDVVVARYFVEPENFLKFFLVKKV